MVKHRCNHGRDSREVCLSPFVRSGHTTTLADHCPGGGGVFRSERRHRVWACHRHVAEGHARITVSLHVGGSYAAIAALALLAVAGRPLLFASIDPQIARAQRVPVGLLSSGFLLLLGLAVAATSQITGALLVFALLVTPAAAARTLTSRPALGLLLSTVLALLTVWLRTRDRVLLAIPGRVLDHERRVRDLPLGSACERDPRAREPAEDRATAPRGGLMFAYEFVRNAYLAGTLIALACGLIGWFVVLRGQVFAGDALSHVAFTGAVSAAAIGIDPRIGLFAASLVLASVLAGLGRRALADDVAIGTVFSWILGLGVLCVAFAATGSRGGESAITAANTLFGSIFGLDRDAARLAAVLALACCAGLLAIARPLLFASIDPDVARARGVPTRALGVAFLLLLGVVAGEATQAVGALLLLGLLAAPAGAASKLTANPWLGLALSAAIAVGSMWGGLALSYQIAALPPSTAILLIAAGAYLLARLAQRLPGPGPDTADPLDLVADDEARAARRRKRGIRPGVDPGKPVEQVPRRVAGLHGRPCPQHRIRVQDSVAVTRGLEGESDTRVTLDVLELLVVVHVPADDLVALKPDPDHGHLWASVGIDRAQVGERPGLDQLAQFGGQAGPTGHPGTA